jgi:restriction endonuclease Mrr
VVLVLLERLGYSSFDSVRRPGTPSGELHYSAKYTSPLGESSVAVVIRRDGRDVGREQVTELRGSLHHYEGAAQGLILTTGQVLSGARDEAMSPGATPVSLIDGSTLARLADEYGVGVLHVRCNLPVPDPELFDSLRNL